MKYYNVISTNILNYVTSIGVFPSKDYALYAANKEEETHKMNRCQVFEIELDKDYINNRPERIYDISNDSNIL